MQINTEQKELLKKFNKFLSFKGRFALILSLVIFILYYVFVLSIGLFPDILGYKLGPTSVSLGIIFGVFLIVLCLVTTGIYTYIANYFLDKEQNDLLENIRKQGLLEALQNGELNFKEYV
ncbi:DUF485 domain-containing protein [Campylobacter sp. MIT 97-5078]|uniref:DUF485 domain-containing protein n=1 Tax=Campylobacter sp. MIT 97-5078 TaxID=1548153 RepID=UPI000512C81E|nr:DUF485 domain-containing protein [Campylobacter sp. MIT 97-5078]KGI57334.1 hypothetical protein LR59_00960 [Campylobacter sp. MIT 97-5078]TQR28317.1 DUF485 domain-containing protein [Campylobacter sp. MIT 97-5078]